MAKKKTTNPKSTPKKKKPAKKVKVSRSSKKKVSAKTASTMDELLKQTGYRLHGFRRGEEVKATVVEKTKKVLYLDIGGKSEGMVIDREMKAAAGFIVDLKVGDKVKVIVTQPENDRGQTLLSLKKAASDHLWGLFESSLKSGKILKVRGKEINQGGLIVYAKGLQGFIPGSQFGTKLADNIKSLINQEIEVKVIEADSDKNRLIFSEREVSEAELLQAQKEVLEKVKIGQKFEGEVVGVMNFGLFVKVKVKGVKAKTKKSQKKKEKAVELEGLVHISEISWEKVENPDDLYKEGDKVKVKVLAVDEKSGRLNLSIKQLQDDPWEKIEKKYKPDTKVKGEVVKLAPFGAFVNLELGIEGLIHLSKIPAEKSIKVGDKVNCYVESIDKESRRMSLGLVLTKKPVGYK